jgi:NADH-quinone oxidoreductase subunit J
MLFTTLLFYIFSTILIASAFAVISAKNTVYSVMFLILAFVNASGLFILLGAEFLAMLLIIVYVGAVAVLFLFVVMMLNIDDSKDKVKSIPFPFAIIVSIILAIELYIIVNISDVISSNLQKAIFLPIDKNISNTNAIGNVLYTDFIYPFQLSGAILFVAMIGAIVLTIRENTRYIKKQSISQQVNRKKEDSVKLVKLKPGQGINV